ncbi:MAG: c-type cytochrome [Gammaproteobacteria bacterium]
MKMRLLYILTCLLFFPVTSAWPAGDAVAGKQKTQICLACHGPAGASTSPVWPKLAGQHARYIQKQLNDFKSGKRKNAQMSPMTATLSKEDIDDVAAYYAAQKPDIGVAKPDHLSLGEKLYRAGNPKTRMAACMACHSPNGAGNPAARYPMLRGQHAEYVATTLKAFKAESRNNDQNGIMRNIASKMTNAEIEAVSNYIQGLH